MMIDLLVYGALIVVGAPVVLYYAARLVSLAYFKTKHEQEKRNGGLS